MTPLDAPTDRGPVDPDFWAKRARQHRDAQAVRLGFAVVARNIWRDTRGTARGGMYRAAMAAELEYAAAFGRAKRSARRLEARAKT